MSATLNKDIFLNYFSNEELDKLEKEIKEDQYSSEYFFDSSKFKKNVSSSYQVTFIKISCGKNIQF